MGLVWSVIASLLFSVMAVFVKLGAHWFSAAELVFYRSFFGLIGLTLIMISLGRSMRTPVWRWHLARGVSGAVALLCFFYAISHLPLGSAISLNYTSPLFLALYLGIHKKNRPSRLLLIALCLGFLGVWLMLKPIFSGYSLLAVTLGLISGALAGFAYLAVRELGEQGEPPERIVWYFTLTSLFLSAVWTAPSGWHFPREAIAWWVIGGLALSANAAQMALTQAYRRGPTLAVSCLAYSTVLFSALAELLFWPQSTQPSVWIGEALIVLSGVLAVWSSRRQML